MKGHWTTKGKWPVFKKCQGHENQENTILDLKIIKLWQSNVTRDFDMNQPTVMNITGTTDETWVGSED